MSAKRFQSASRRGPSPNISFLNRKALVLAADNAVADHPDPAGIVVLHGTATLEETAYALNLTAKVPVPIVVAGAQRPASALSTDAGMNLVDAVRVAACPEARGLGVLVVQSTRAGRGRMHPLPPMRDAGILGADNLTPVKARILIALALTGTNDPVEMQRSSRRIDQPASTRATSAGNSEKCENVAVCGKAAIGAFR